MNSLLNIDRYLEEADKNLSGLDKVVIMLGTNDCKAIFEERKKEIPNNMSLLLKKIKAHPVYLKHRPQLYLVSPPPCGEDQIMRGKYHGSSERIKKLVPELKKVAALNDCKFIDIYTALSPNWHYLAKDGIHPEEEGQVLMSQMIHEQLN